MKNNLDLLRELTDLYNKYGLDNTYETPDFILAEHTLMALQTMNTTLNSSRRWHGWQTLGVRLGVETEETK